MSKFKAFIIIINIIRKPWIKYITKARTSNIFFKYINNSMLKSSWFISCKTVVFYFIINKIIY